MAQESKEYLVDIQINEADLEAKLENIKQRIDNALSGDIFSNPLPQASMLMSYNLPMSMPSIAPPLPEIGSDTGFWTSVMNAFDNFAQNAQLGFSRFTDTARRTALLSKQFFPDPPEFVPPTGPFQTQFGPKSYTEAILGIGYDPNMPLSRGNYDRMRGKFIEEGIKEFDVSSLLATGTVVTTGAQIVASLLKKTALAAALAPVAIATEVVDLGYLTAKALSRNEQDIDELSEGIQNMTSSVLNLSIRDADAQNIARELNNITKSVKGRALGMDFETMQAQIAMFASKGGLTGVSNTEELKERLTGFITNLREVSYNFGLFQEEAVAIMADLERKAITTASQMGDFSARMANLARSNNLEVGELLGAGMQTVDMLQGSGITARNAFNIGIRSRLDVASIIENGGSQIIEDIGGVNAAAAALSEGAIRWGLSGQGMLYTAALQGGSYSAGDGMNALFSSASNFLSGGLGPMIDLMANQGRLLNSQSTAELRAAQIGLVYDIAKNMNLLDENNKLSMDRGAYIMQSLGMVNNINEARLMFKALQSDAARDLTQESTSAFLASMQSLADATATGNWEEFKAKLSASIYDLTTTDMFYDSVKGLSNWWEDVATEIGDWWGNKTTINKRGEAFSTETIKNAKKLAQDIGDFGEDTYWFQKVDATAYNLAGFRLSGYKSVEDIQNSIKNLRDEKFSELDIYTALNYNRDVTPEMILQTKTLSAGLSQNKQEINELFQDTQLLESIKTKYNELTNDFKLGGSRALNASGKLEAFVAKQLYADTSLGELNTEQLQKINSAIFAALPEDDYEYYMSKTENFVKDLKQELISASGTYGINEKLQNLTSIKNSAEATINNEFNNIFKEAGIKDTEAFAFTQLQNDFAELIKSGVGAEEAYNIAVNNFFKSAEFKKDPLLVSAGAVLDNPEFKNSEIFKQRLNAAEKAVKLEETAEAAIQLTKGAENIIKSVGLDLSGFNEEFKDKYQDIIIQAFGDKLGSGEAFEIANLQKAFENDSYLSKQLTVLLQQLQKQLDSGVDITKTQKDLQNLASMIDFNPNTQTLQINYAEDPQSNFLGAYKDMSSEKGPALRVYVVKSDVD